MIVTFRNIKTGFEKDVEIPADITANELYRALDAAYHLRDREEGDAAQDACLKFENPIALLKGNRPASDLGIHDGSIIMYS